MADKIMMLILESAPSIAAIASVIVACVKISKGFDSLKGEVLKTKEYKEIKRELAASHRENVALKKQISELLTKLDRINRK